MSSSSWPGQLAVDDTMPLCQLTISINSPPHDAHVNIPFRWLLASEETRSSRGMSHLYRTHLCATLLRQPWIRRSPLGPSLAGTILTSWHSQKASPAGILVVVQAGSVRAMSIVTLDIRRADHSDQRKERTTHLVDSKFREMKHGVRHCKNDVSDGSCMMAEVGGGNEMVTGGGEPPVNHR